MGVRPPPRDDEDIDAGGGLGLPPTDFASAATNKPAPPTEKPVSQPSPPVEEPEASYIIKFPVTHEAYDHHITRNTRSMMRFYDITERGGCSRGFLDEFLGAVRDETVNQNFDINNAESRRTFVAGFCNNYPTPEPHMRNCPLENGESSTDPDNMADTTHRGIRDSVEVATFDFEAQLRDLLSDNELFGNVDNLVVNDTGDVPDSFQPYRGDGRHLDEVLDGAWYKRTVALYQAREGENRRRFVLPIIFYVDKTGTTHNQRHGVEPLVFTVGILKREIRNQPRAWRCLGYIPDLEQKSSAVKAAARSTIPGKGIGIRNYHNVLRMILESFYAAQQKRPLYVRLRIGQFVGEVSARLPLAFVIGDGKNRDTLTGRYGSYVSQNRISSPCHTRQEGCDSHSTQCELSSSKLFEYLSALASVRGVEPKTAAQVEDLTAEQLKDRKRVAALAKKQRKMYTLLLHEMSQHRHFSAFAGCDFGANPRGIVAATPVDLMHAFLEGVLKYALRIYIDPMAPRFKRRLDYLVDKMFGLLRNAENARASFLKSNYSHGYTNLTMLTADEWAGMAFTLLVVSLSSEGQALFKEAKKYKEREREGEDGMIELAAGIEERKAAPPVFDMKGRSDRPKFHVAISNKYASGAYCDEYCAKTNKDGAYHDEFIDLELGYRGAGVAARKQSHDATIQDDNADNNAGDAPDAPDDRDGCKPDFREPDNDSTGGIREDEKGGESDTAYGFVELLEMMLCFHAFYKRGAPYEWSDPDASQKNILIRIRTMMAMLVMRLPRTSGKGWELQKFHDLLHVAQDMGEFGSPQNVDAGPGESSLKQWAKYPAKTTQKRGHAVFNRQLAARVHERSCFMKLMRLSRGPDLASAEQEQFPASSQARLDDNRGGADRVHDHEASEPSDVDSTTMVDRLHKKHQEEEAATARFSEDPIPSEMVGKPKYTISPSDMISNGAKVTWHGRKPKGGTKRTLTLHPVVSKFLYHRLQQPRFDPNEGSDETDDTAQRKPFRQTTLSGFTEYKRDGKTFRAHPDYSSRGEWYDWTMIHWEATDDVKSPARKKQREEPVEADQCYAPSYNKNSVPAKILAFVKVDDGPDKGKEYAVVHSCDHKSEANRKRDSRILEHWNLEYQQVSREGPRDTRTTGADGRVGQGIGVKVTEMREPQLSVVSVDSLGERVLAIEENPGLKEGIRSSESTGVFVAKDRDRFWPQQFLIWDCAHTKRG